MPFDMEAKPHHSAAERQPASVTIFYDGARQSHAALIRRIRNAVQSHSADCPVLVRDRRRYPHALDPYRVDRAGIARRGLFVVDEQARLRRGLAARVAIWRAVPRWRWRAWLLEHGPAGLMLRGRLTAVVAPAAPAWDHSKRGGTMPESQQEKPSLTTVYNAACPVCGVEIGHYEKIARKRNLPMGFRDLNDPATLAETGIDDDAARRRLHVIRADGTVLRGVDAFLALWREMPRYRWLARLVGMPGIKQLAWLAYEGALAPIIYRWDARRRRKSGRRAARQ